MGSQAEYDRNVLLSYTTQALSLDEAEYEERRQRTITRALWHGGQGGRVYADQCIYSHPYANEIKQMKYPDFVYQRAEPILYQPVNDSKATWVDTFEGVLEMLEELKQAKEIAIDLEHHDYRSYMGIVCLMQISTREKDWIVDTLMPWRHKLDVLNEVFADPKILKVCWRCCDAGLAMI